MKKLVLVLLVLLCVCSLHGKYHPGIKWLEISDDNFIVVFPKGYEDEARYTLNAARKLYGSMKELWWMELKTRTRIILSDVFDESNGSATFYPFNLIELYLFSPLPDSTTGTYRQRIDQVLSHELTHIFNMNAGSGFTYFLRGIAGSNPGLFPVIHSPMWLIEGIAVYTESLSLSGGRLHTADYNSILESAALVGSIPKLSQLYGEPTVW
ncbi:MAG: hypothetical protein GY765_08315, partial [bacterium]|nr:hypothetical protein [bacterium]